MLSDARFAMLVHGTIIIALVVGVTALCLLGKAPAELIGFVYAGALGYAGGRTMNNGSSSSGGGGA